MQFIRIKSLLLLFSFVWLILLPNINHAQTYKTPENWKRINLPLFSFFAPSDFISEPFQGKDSIIWKYQNQDMRLTIDLGFYSAKSSEDKNEDSYKEKSTIIDKKKATIVSFKYSDSDFIEFKFVTAVYFPKIGSDETKLSLVVHSKTSENQKNAEKIFRSIRFNSQKK